LSSAETAAGEIYDGGTGNDTLTDSNASGVAIAIDPGVTFTRIENLFRFTGGLALTAAQLASFTGTIQTGAIALSSAGAVDLSGANIVTSAFSLSASGNSLTLNNTADFTVNRGAGADTVTIVDPLTTGHSAHLYGNGGNDTLVGGNSGDTIEGGAGNDTLTGGAGGDSLTGGAGADLLTGGAGADYYVYNGAADSIGTSYDTVAGFTAGVDKFDLRPSSAIVVDTPITNTAYIPQGRWSRISWGR